jgi:hypothetical protein
VPIRQDDEYHGLRLSMSATLSRARLKLQLDVSFGDPVTPAPALIEYPQYLTDETFTLYGYPIATVIAEKLSTAIALGDLNTRDRDYADLHQHRRHGSLTVSARFRRTPSAAITCYAAGSYTFAESDPYSGLDLSAPTFAPCLLGCPGTGIPVTQVFKKVSLSSGLLIRWCASPAHTASAICPLRHPA